MTEDRFENLFADLGAEMDSAEQIARDGELLAETELAWADRHLLDRLAGAVGAEVDIGVAGRRVAGRLRAVSVHVVLVDTGDEVAVATAEIEDVRLSRLLHRDADLVSRLGWGSPLRRMMERGARCTFVYGQDKTLTDGRIMAVARDYLQLAGAGGAFLLIPFNALVLVRASL